MQAGDSVISDRDQRLGEIVAIYLSARAKGESCSEQELVALHPEFAGELAEFLAESKKLDRLAAPLRMVTSSFPNDQGALDLTPSLAGKLWPESEQPTFSEFEILEEIGRGGMGRVYKARQNSLHRLIALKVVRVRDVATSSDLHRFRNEAETVGALDHPHIVPVYDVGEQAGYLFLSMKLIEGGGLAGRLHEFSADPRAAAGLVARVARAVHHAHQRGVLHRDLKPANILLDPGGQPHVTDFGLAKWLETDSQLTLSGALIGTPSYMAPEQTQGKRGAVTTATDVYGLGAVLYALLTGRPPFRGETVLDTLTQVRDAEPKPPRGFNSKLDRDLETIWV